MRTKIWKGLKTQSAAIKTALRTYNSIAEKMIPPTPILEWKDTVSYTFISEFDLLKHSYSKDDIQSQPWCNAVNREIAAKYFKVLHAQEEITHLNVEIRRLYTLIRDEYVFLKGHIKSLKQEDLLLSMELQRHLTFKLRVHRIHLLWI